VSEQILTAHQHN